MVLATFHYEFKPQPGHLTLRYARNALRELLRRFGTTNRTELGRMAGEHASCMRCRSLIVPVHTTGSTCIADSGMIVASLGTCLTGEAIELRLDGPYDEGGETVFGLRAPHRVSRRWRLPPPLSGHEERASPRVRVSTEKFRASPRPDARPRIREGPRPRSSLRVRLKEVGMCVSAQAAIKQ